MADKQNPYWYRVAASKPRLRPHARLHRQVQRDQLWYVLQDEASGRHFRFPPQAYFFIGLLDGSRTVEEAWESARLVLGEEAPEQEDVIRLLSQLHSADVLDGYQTPDPEEVFERSEQQRRRQRMQRYLSPLAVRIPLLDPEWLLQRMRPLANGIFSRVGVMIWLAVLLYGGYVAAIEFDQLSDNIVDRVLAAQNLLIILIAFPFLKLLHEFGHGFAVARWGGEVHEMGIMFLVFMPIPYVDASAATVFRSRWQRAWVSAAGMYVEMFLAALAVIAWSAAEPGFLRSVLFNIALIGSVTTLLFNINPLLRFDGYYIFCDLIDIPNLGSRANKHLLYLAQRFLLGIEDVSSPVAARGEGKWFVVYSIASFIYRAIVVSLIALFVAGKFFLIGVLLALLSLTMMVILPLLKLLRFLLLSPRMRRRGSRAYMGAGLTLATILGVLFFLPFPLTTYSEGVVWVPESAELTVGESGFVDSVSHQSGDWVAAGDTVLTLDNPELDTEIQALNARLKALAARYDADRVHDLVQSELTALEIEHSKERLNVALARQQRLRLAGENEGRLLLSNTDDMQGSFLHRGQVLGFVVNPDDVHIRTVVDQANVGLVRERLEGVQVLMANHLDRELPAQMLREVPAASDRLPSAVLSTEGGGEVALDPARANEGPRALNNLFHFELLFKQLPETPRIGQRVHVKFFHGYEPIGYQAIRRLRQLFLSRFGV